jgi:molecular chaperone GrpE
MAEKERKLPTEESTGNSSDIDINPDENQTDTGSMTGAAEGNSETEKLKEELAQTKDKYLRLVAEFDNFRRRSAKERVELIQTAGKEIITDMLNVLDDCDRAQKQIETTDDIHQVKEGVLLVFNKLRNFLQSKGVKAMESNGKDFNPDLHEAITEIPAPSEDMKGKVVDEVVKGYYLNDKLIRHAKVVVGN